MLGPSGGAADGWDAVIAWAASWAWAVPVSMGVGGAAQFDLPNPAPLAHTQFGPGAQLVVPVWVALADHAWLRVMPTFEFAQGTDRLTWDLAVGGTTHRVGDDDHLSFHTGAGALLGPELRVPLGGDPHLVFNFDAGATWVGTFHALDEDTQILFDPAQNDLDNPNNVDPYSGTVAPRVGLSVGYDARGAAPLRVEVGWSTAWVPDAPLAKTPVRRAAVREAYAYDVVRTALVFPFGR